MWVRTGGDGMMPPDRWIGRTPSGFMKKLMTDATKAGTV
jgi:hypothetical protein